MIDDRKWRARGNIHEYSICHVLLKSILGIHNKSRRNLESVAGLWRHGGSSLQCRRDALFEGILRVFVIRWVLSHVFLALYWSRVVHLRIALKSRKPSIIWISCDINFHFVSNLRFFFKRWLNHKIVSTSF